MKKFYALIDENNGRHYGYTFDYNKALAEAERIEDKENIAIYIYEFYPDEEF